MLFPYYHGAKPNLKLPIPTTLVQKLYSPPETHHCDATQADSAAVPQLHRL